MYPFGDQKCSMSFFIRGADNKIVNMEESLKKKSFVQIRFPAAVQPVLHWVRLPQTVQDQDLADGHQAGARGGQHGQADRRLRHPGEEHLRRYHGHLCADPPYEHHQSGFTTYVVIDRNIMNRSGELEV